MPEYERVQICRELLQRSGQAARSDAGFFIHMKNKKSFILYTDLIHTVEKMPDDKAGELFKTILQYVNDQNPEPTDLIIALTFEPVRQQLKRDLTDWRETVEKRREAGRSGGKQSGITRSKPKQNEANEANASILKQTEANEAVTDNGTDNVTGNDNKKRESGENATTHTPEFLAFQKWVGENCPSVLKMKEPITQDQFKKLTGDFSGKQIAETLKAMHNKMDLVKKYKSANLTLRNWIKIENKKSTQYGTKESARISNREQSALIDARIMEKLTGGAMDQDQEGPGIIPMQE